MPSIRPASPDDAEGCVAVLASLPGFFTRETHDEVRGLIGVDTTWVALSGDAVAGFVLVTTRYPSTAEIAYAAVRPDRQGRGVGTGLIDAALEGLASRGVVLVEVKTLDASAGYEPYVATRAFWERCGFRQTDCIDPLPGWQAGNPSAIYVASLAATP